MLKLTLRYTFSNVSTLVAWSVYFSAGYLVGILLSTTCLHILRVHPFLCRNKSAYSCAASQRHQTVPASFMMGKPIVQLLQQHAKPRYHTEAYYCCDRFGAWTSMQTVVGACARLLSWIRQPAFRRFEQVSALTKIYMKYDGAQGQCRLSVLSNLPNKTG